MSNNEQVCKHYMVDSYCASTFFSCWIKRKIDEHGGQQSFVSCGGKRDKCECFEPRERKKVRKEVKAWAVITVEDKVREICIDEAKMRDFYRPHPLYKLVEMRGTYEVEE